MTKGEISAFIDTISPTGPGGVIKIKKVLRELLKQKKEGEIVTVEELEEALLKKQDTLVSGENVKTVGGQSIVGKGNIEVGDKDAIKFVLQQLTEAQKAQARANIDAYKKPSTGIPASDIATGVIPDISGKQDTITDLSTIRSGAAAGATAYQKPTSGIPKIDLSSNVQSSLDLADTAVQAEPVGPIIAPPETDEFATKTQVSQLQQKVSDISTGKYYGYYATVNALPDDADIDGFAYVGTGPTYTIYNCQSGVWASSGLTVNQSPIGNKEDIDQDANGKLQFADRVYDSQNPNGMGYIILRKDKIFAEQVTKEKTIYEIRYDFDLNNAEVTIPTGCVLKFNGGSLINGAINMQGGAIATLSNNILNNVSVSNIKDNTLFADWFIEGGIVNQSLLEYFAKTAGTIIWGNADYTLSEVGGISLDDGTKFIGDGGTQSHFILTPATGAPYVFRFYDNCAFENILFDVQVNQVCDVLRFDTSRYNNIKGKDPWITLRGLTIRAPYVSASQTNYAVTALRFLVRNNNDDGTNNGNKYNILSRRCNISDINVAYSNGVIFEVTQNTLAAEQVMVYANSIAFEKFRISSNIGFKFIRTNNSSSPMYSSLGIEINDCFVQVLVPTISDNYKAIETRGINLVLSNTIIWDSPEPILIDGANINVYSSNLQSATTSAADSRYQGAKCLNGGELRVIDRPKRITMPMDDYDTSTGTGALVISPSQDTLDTLFDGLPTLPKKRETLTSALYGRKVFGNNNYYFFNEEIDRTNLAYKKEIYDVSTGRHYVLENYKYVDNGIIPLYNNLFAIIYSFNSVVVNANSCCTYTLTLNYSGTIPSLVVLGAFAYPEFARVIKTSISGNVISIVVDTTEWGNAYYSFSVVILLRSQNFEFVELPTSVTGNQIGTSIKRRQGTTGYRPSGVPIGFMYYDTTIGKPIWCNGTAWVDATGATV